MPKLSLRLMSCVLALGLVQCSPPSGKTKNRIPPDCATRAVPGIGGPFRLTDHNGRIVTEKAFSGRQALVYFGFTYCPDVCPATLYRLGRALEKLPSHIPKPMTLLISVDPERDTPQELARYIRNNGFPEDMAGLTGSHEEISATAKAFASAYSRFEDPESAAGYSVDHTSILYLMDENWQLKTFFTHEATPDLIAQCIRALS